MTAPRDPTSDADDGDESHDQQRGGERRVGSDRRLRARRSLPAPRLLERGDGGAVGPAAHLDLNGDRPLTFMRLGRQDLETGMRAVRDGARPTAVVTGVAESRETTVRARHLTQEAGVSRLADPLLFRTALDGYRTAPNLQTLDYTPGRDGDPYRPEEFDDPDLERRVGRSVVGAQVDLRTGAAMSGAFVVERIDDPWLAVNQRLLRIGADAAAAWDVPLIATLPLRMSGFDRLESQRLLVRALAARRPAAWLLMIDGISEDSSPERLVAALRLALLLQATSAPVILARAGDLRRLFWALGVAGVEFGLGRLLRFSVPDFRKTKRGPGPTPGPRVELPSLGCSVPFEQARRLLAGELVAEVDCTCAACSAAVTLAARMNAAAEHDAHVVLEQAKFARGKTPAARVDALDSDLRAAVGRCGWAEPGEPLGGLRPRIERQRAALQAAVEAGLLEPARLADELRLFD